MAKRTYLRWDKHQRLQHFLLMVSVTLLVLTGLPLKYPEARVSQGVMRLVGGPKTAGQVHRLAAVLLMVGAFYHLLYLGGVCRRHGFSTAMWPRFQDVRDLLQMLRYFVGLSPSPPRFDRYSYTEKFEYWAMVWGTLIMVITGLMLWFPVGTTRFFSVLMLHIAQVIHSYEALLAALSLILWHFYHAHLNPDVFPMSKVWLTGRMTEQEMRHHHPLEYERLLAQEQRNDDQDRVAPVGGVGHVGAGSLVPPAVHGREPGASSAIEAEDAGGLSRDESAAPPP